jgi:hypothetical protein
LEAVWIPVYPKILYLRMKMKKRRKKEKKMRKEKKVA